MPCKALQQNKSSIGLYRSQPLSLMHETGNASFFLFFFLLTGYSDSHTYNCTLKIKKDNPLGPGTRLLLAGLHGATGPQQALQ